MRESLDTVVIGGAHAGLSISYFLTDLDREHVVLERGRVGETWRSRRGNSFPPCNAELDELTTGLSVQWPALRI